MTKQLEQELTAWMQRQAEQAPHDTDLEPGAFRTSRRIRLQRRIASTAVVAAVLGLAVPAGLQAINLANGPDHPQVANTPTTIETPQESPRPRPQPVPTSPVHIDFDRLPRGVTTLPWWSSKERAIHDGSILYPLKTAPGDLAKIGEQSYVVLNVRKEDGVRSLELVGRQGRIPVEPISGYSLAISPNGEEVAWVTNDSMDFYSVNVASTETGKRVDQLGLGNRPDLSVAGFVGSAVILSSDRGVAKSEVKIWNRESSSPGEIKSLEGAHATASAQNAPVISVLTHLQDDTTGNGRWCGTVGKLGEAPPLWESCELMAVALSPDGRYALTQPSDTEGAGAGSFTVVDLRTGKTGLEIRADLLSQFAWEADSRHFVVEALIGGRTALVRSDIYGNLELISEPVAYNFPEVDQPYVLGRR